MALIACPECGNQVSTRATACPSCGCPVNATASGSEPAQVDHSPAVISTPSLDEVVLTVRRSYWNVSGHTLTFVAVILLLVISLPRDWWNYAWPIPVLWVLALLMMALYNWYSFVMRIYPDRVSIFEGFFSREMSEFFIKDIRAIDVKQGFWGRVVNVGNLTISTAAAVEAAEEAHGVSHPGRIRDLLISLRQRSRQ